MVARPAWVACALAVPAMALSCQMVWGIEEKHLADSQEDAGSDAEAQTSIIPPERPSGSRTPSHTGKTLTFALRRLFLGTIAIDGTMADDALRWKDFGYDLDGRCTTVQQSKDDATGVCKKTDFNLPNDVHADGKGCRDNTGGFVLAGAFKAPENPEALMQQMLEDGSSYTLLLQIDDLDSGADDAYAPGWLYVGSPRLATEPARKWDGTDSVAVDMRSVLNGSLASPRTAFLEGYVRNHVWVSNDLRGAVPELPLPLFGTVSFAQGRTATLTVQLDPAHERASGESVLSAAITGDSYRQAVWPGLLLQVGCIEYAANSSFPGIQRYADLADTPSLVDPPATCALMSMGMQAVWAPVRAPDLVVAERPAPKLCNQN